MFKPSTDKPVHSLAHKDVLLWDGEYYIVESVTHNGPAFTYVLLVPVAPKGSKRRELLRSDTRVMLHTWQQ